MSRDRDVVIARAGQGLDRPQRASLRLKAGPLTLRLRIEVTPIGLLAAGGLVSAILLSVVPIVRAGTEPLRQERSRWLRE